MMNLQSTGLLASMFPFLKWENKFHKSAKSKYYQSRLNRVDSWEKLYKLSQNLKNKIESNRAEVYFFNIPFGQSPKDIIQKLGKPRYVINNQAKIHGHEVYFYKFNFHGIVAKAEVHFLDKQYFMASYFFNRTIDGVGEEVLDTLIRKYTELTSFDFENSFQIVDAQNNKLIVEKDVDYVVTYLSGDATLYSTILQQIKEAGNAEWRKNELRKASLVRAL